MSGDDNWVLIRPTGPPTDEKEQQMFMLAPDGTITAEQIKGFFQVPKVQYLVNEETKIQVYPHEGDNFGPLERKASYTFVAEVGVFDTITSILSGDTQMKNPAVLGNTFERTEGEYEYCIMFDLPSTDGENREARETVRRDLTLLRKHLHAAGLQTACQLSRDKDEIFVLVTISDERCFEEAERIGLQKFLRDNAGLAPFKNSKKDQFLHTNKKAPFFSSGERQQMIQSIFKAANSEGGLGGLDLTNSPKLEDVELTIKDHFPLHCESELDYLNDVWGSWGELFTLQVQHWFAQPYDMLRDYFGEAISLYFAWLGFYTMALVPPAGIGFVLFLAEIGDDTGVSTIMYSVTIALWAVIYLEFWKRRETELKFKWGTEGFEETEELRPEFTGLVRINPITEKEEVVVSTTWRLFQFSCSFAVVFFMMVSVILTNLVILYIRLLAVDAGKGDAAGDYVASYITANNVTEPVCGLSSSFIVSNPDIITETEEYCTCLVDSSFGEKDYVWYSPVEECYVEGTSDTDPVIVMNVYINLTAVMAVICISVWNMIYEKVVTFLNDWENHWTDTQFTDSLILKNFAFQFVNNFFALFYIAFLKSGELFGKDSKCIGNDCFGELRMQLIIVFTVKTAIAQLMEVAMPFVKQHIKMKMEQREMEKSGVISSTDEKLPPHEEQSKRETYPGLFDDYNEMAIQFGYVTLFAPAFPLAAFLALANNLTEIRGDAIKICKGLRRPVYARAEDIGTWFQVLNVLSVTAVLTNSFIIAFVGKRLCDDSEGSDICDDVQTRYEEGYLWAYAIIIEHCVMIFRAILQFMIPDEPEYIRSEREAQQAKQKNMLETEEEKAEKERSKAEIQRRMSAFSGKD
eukprot:Rmarinus@m.24092